MERKEGVRKLENYKVLYIKGKYQYKKQYPVIQGKHSIVYAGPVEPMVPIWDCIMDILRQTDRICTESRRELKKLESRSQNQFNFKKEGITHIIVYKCLEQ